MEKKAIIVGAGPAGLTAAYELLTRTNIKPIILEKSGDIGGISKTVNYKGNRIDIGGHRFFSKSDRVMNWWLKMMPMASTTREKVTINYHGQSHEVSAGQTAPSEDPDKVLLVRPRLSRIYFLRKFFSYPVQLSFDTLRKLGLVTTISILYSYLMAQIFPRRPEKSLEDFMINRFGKVLYRLFFKDYTEKVWGLPCERISAEWGAQRIKGVSISKAIRHAIQSAVAPARTGDIFQKGAETSLIEQFLYPKYGPGQLWEEVARQIESMGGQILMQHDVEQIYTNEAGDLVTAISATNKVTGEPVYLEGDYFFSTMPVKELIAGMGKVVPFDVQEIAGGLQYRDFITVGILLKKLSRQDEKTGEWIPLELKDTWIYIQEKDVKVGRLQLFNNWSPFMVKDPDTVWVGMEFFCSPGDGFWEMSDGYLKDLAIRELEKIGLASQGNVLDTTVLRMEKTYPAYFGAYEQFDRVRAYVDGVENLFLVGRNGMHKYNNSDHSMLTAMVAVDNISGGVTAKDNIWAVNTEQEYHEEKSTRQQMSKVGNSQKSEMPEQVGEQESFSKFVFRTHKTALKFIVPALIVQFLVFKTMYPFMNFITDSYSYLEGAYYNYDINMWPIGYSKFLRVFGAFFKSDILLSAFQYAALEMSVLYFVFSLMYILRPGKGIKNTLLVFFTINPILLLISNYVLADALFTALTIVWVTELLWILTGYRKRYVWIQVIILPALLMLRFNALYYPIIAAVLLMAARISLNKKMATIGLSLLLVGLFIWHSGNKYKELTGIRQFSGFGGWQMATNSLIMLSQMPIDYNEQVPAEFRTFHQMVLHHLDSLNKVRVRPDSIPGVYFLWADESPLKQFVNSRYRRISGSYFEKWSAVASFYGAYGKYMILKHPVEYVKYYIWPNVIAFAVPPTEFMNVYNMGKDSVQTVAQNWFGYRDQRVRSAGKDIKIAAAYPVVVTLSNGMFLLGAFGFVSFGGMKKAAKKLRIVFLMFFLVWLGNFGFSVLAAPIVLRYQLITMVFFFSIGLLLFEYVMKNEDDNKGTEIIKR